MKHKDCGGYFEQYEIREHNFCFMKCSKCSRFLGNHEKVAAEIKKLMQIRVRPTIRRV